MSKSVTVAGRDVVCAYLLQVDFYPSRVSHQKDMVGNLFDPDPLILCLIY